MSKITVRKAERLAELAGDVESELSRVLDTIDELADDDLKGDDRESSSEDYEDALLDLERAVKALREGKS